jgi:hypothetical protein
VIRIRLGSLCSFLRDDDRVEEGHATYYLIRLMVLGRMCVDDWCTRI